MSMKKIIIFILTLICLLSCVLPLTAQAVYNTSVELDSEIYLLVSKDSGTVVFSQNPDEKASPASLVKIVTAILTVENCENLDEKTTVSSTAVRPLDNTGSTMAGLVVGEEISIRDLLYCLMLQSANDAANVLAEYTSGSIDAFVKKMNKFVSDIGCANTHFTNPHGLDDDEQYTTANDMVKIAQYMLNIPSLTEITNTVYYTVQPTNKTSEERNLITSVDIINSYRGLYYYEYANGIKTGYTSKAGRSVVTTATKNGYTYIAVAMKAPNIDKDGDGYNDNTALLDCKKMFQWAFKNMKLATVADTSTYVCELPVKLSSDADHIRVVPAQKVNALVPSGVDESSINFESDLPESINAPVKKGDKVGHAKIMYADSVVAEVDLVSGDDVNVNALMFVLNIFKTIFTSPIFLTILAIAAVGAGIYIYIVAHRGRKKVSKYKARMNNRITDDDDNDTIIRKTDAELTRLASASGKKRGSQSSKKTGNLIDISDRMKKGASALSQKIKNEKDAAGKTEETKKQKKAPGKSSNDRRNTPPAPPSPMVGDEDEFDFSMFE